MSGSTTTTAACYRCPHCGRMSGACPCRACKQTRKVNPKTGNVTCRNCGTDVVFVKWDEEYRVGMRGASVVLSFSEKPQRKRRATWYLHRGDIFFRCWVCGKLNKMPRSDIDSTGHTKPRGYEERRCFSCNCCHVDGPLYFKGWPKVVKKKRGRGKRK